MLRIWTILFMITQLGRWNWDIVHTSCRKVCFYTGSIDDVMQQIYWSSESFTLHFQIQLQTFPEVALIAEQRLSCFIASYWVHPGNKASNKRATHGEKDKCNRNSSLPIGKFAKVFPLVISQWNISEIWMHRTNDGNVDPHKFIE